MAKKKTKQTGYTITQLSLFGLMLVASVGLLTLERDANEVYSPFFMFSGLGLFALSFLYFVMIRKPAKKGK